MPVITYHIRIKKNYAADVIKDLQKMEAVELLEEISRTSHSRMAEKRST